MVEADLSAGKAPRHVLVVGVVSLLWNAMGAVDYTMTKLGNQAWLKGAPPAMLKAIAEYPAWATAAWALGVWGSLLGSVLLILRSRHALTAFMASLVGLAVNTWAQQLAHIPTVGALAAMIWGILLATLVYTWMQVRAGNLR